jgi:two-component system cell cycle response regulator
VYSESAPIILVVDDDWMNRDLMQAHLTVAGYEVVTANSGEKALQLVDAQMPDLILLDVRMHGMSGYDVCAHLKSQEATRHIPIIIVTALDKDEDYQRAVEVGADDFLPKPPVAGKNPRIYKSVRGGRIAFAATAAIPA